MAVGGALLPQAGFEDNDNEYENNEVSRGNHCDGVEGFQGECDGLTGGEDDVVGLNRSSGVVWKKNRRLGFFSRLKRRVFGMSLRERRRGVRLSDVLHEDDNDGDESDNRFVSFRWKKDDSYASVWFFLGRFVLAVGVVFVAFAAILYLLGISINRPFKYSRTIDEPQSSDLSTYPIPFTNGIHSIPCHSHNDYWRWIPLLTAVHYGCTSIEADIFHFPSPTSSRDNTTLYVGHNTASLAATRTLQNLYITPLLTLLNQTNPNLLFNPTQSSWNGIYPTHPQKSLILLIDLKTPSTHTLPPLLDALEPLRQKNLLTTHNTTHKTPGPITLVLTGSTSFDQLLSLQDPKHRYAFYDAPLNLLETNTAFNASNSHLASAPLVQTLGLPWAWFGLSKRQLGLVERWAEVARSRGLVVRFWDTPAWPRGVRDVVWRGLGGVFGDVFGDVSTGWYDRWGGEALLSVDAVGEVGGVMGWVE